jgi:hypothetical protein
MSFFEAAMLICFGASWPLSIAKALRTRQVAGKSRAFLLVVFAGYLCGITHKLLYSLDWVVSLYILNALMVLIDFTLYVRFSRAPTQRL